MFVLARLALVLLFAALAGCKAAPVRPDFVWDESPSSLEVGRKLSNPIDVSWDATALEDAINDIRRKADVNIHVNWAAFSGASIERETPVFITLRGVPAHIVLDLVINQIQGNSEETHFGIKDGIVRVSTRRDLEQIVETQVYDVRVMLVDVPHFSGPPEFNLGAALSGTSSGGGADNPETAAQRAQREAAVDALVTIIQESIGAQSDWRAYGGEVSSLRELNGNLIIKTTPENHRAIERLLRVLRPAGSGEVRVWRSKENRVQGLAP